MDPPDLDDLQALARHRAGRATADDHERLRAAGLLGEDGEPTPEAVRQEAVLRRLLARVLRRAP